MRPRSDRPSSGRPGRDPKSRKQESGQDLALERLFRGFVGHRPDPDYMDRPDNLLSYRSYYHPLTSAKGNQLGKEALARCASFLLNGDHDHRPFRIMDWGTGTGWFAEGVLQAFLPAIPSGRLLEVRLVDRSRAALSVAEETIRSLIAGRGTVRSDVLRLPRIPKMDDGLDLLLEANVLAEQTENVEGFVDALESGFCRLEEGGILLLAEPADRLSSRTLLTVRDALLERLSGTIRLLAPCPNGHNAPCPALREERDWCHEDRPFSFPPDILDRARSVGHVRDALKMSYLIAQKVEKNRVPERQGDSPFLRLVSEIRKERGMVWGIFCDGKDRHRIRLLRRHENEKNHIFSELSRGEGIRAGSPGRLVRHGPFLDLSPDDRIERVPETVLVQPEKDGQNPA